MQNAKTASAYANSEFSDQPARPCNATRASFALLLLFVLRFYGQSTQYDHVEHGQFT